MIPKFSVKKPYTVAVAVVMVFILGIVSFMNMTTDLLPSIDLPYVIVNTVYPGASPEKVESSVTKPLEQSLATTSGIENISSVSNENSSLLILEFNQNVNMDSVMIDLSSKIDMVKGYFDDSVQSPTIMKINPDMMPVMMVSVDMKDMDIKEVTKYVNDTLIPEFERINGVASVDATGLIEDKILISLDEEKIEAINDKIMANIDSEFSKQEKELNKTKSELEKSKATLESETEKQLNSLNSASSEISKGKKQLQDAISGIGMSKVELQEKISESESLLTQNNEKIEELKDALYRLPSDMVDERAELDTQISMLKEISSQISSGIEGAKQGLSLYTSLEELESQESQLKTGKATLEKEVNSAKSQITSGIEQIESAKEQLADAKDSAYKASDVRDKITTDMIGNILMAENFSMPAGYIKENETEYSVKVGEKYVDVDELKDQLLFSIDIDGVGDIKISDVADVTFIDNSADTYTNINGNQGVMLSFQKGSNYSTATVSKSINEVIKKLSNNNDDLHITTLMDQGVYIDMIIDSVLSNLIYGGLLAVIVLLIFLKSARTTLVIACSIPISVLFSIVLMYFSGITLNIISLSGLALGVGMLVDNSIVVIENIYRLKSEGMSLSKACVSGARQVSGAIFASTLTTICVFLPIVFTDGITKQLFVDMGLTIAYSLLASLMVALTVVPAMSSKMLKNVKAKEDKIFDKFVSIYQIVLDYALKYKIAVLSLVLGLLVFCGYKTLNMGTEFMPSMDSTQMTATMTVDEEIKRSELLVMSDEFVEKVLEIEDVETVGATESSGISLTGSSSSNTMSFYIILKEDKTSSNTEIEKLIYENTKDIEAEISVSTSNMDLSALGGSGVEIIIKGQDLDKLQEIALDITNIIEKVEGTTEITNGFEDSITESRVVVDKNKAMSYGLTVAGVYQEISKALETETSSTTMTFNNADYPVVLGKDNSITRENLLDYELKATKDNEEVTIKLSDIATLEESTSLNAINRDNQSRYVSVSASIESGYNVGLVSRDVESELSDYSVPDGYSVEMSGENETINSAIRDMVLMTSMAVIFIYLIMVAQFQSLLSPFIVMFTIPLAFTGGLLALIITGTNISVISMLGFLVLSGVVVNNGIVFVDYINQLRLDGMDRKEAIMKTGRDRIRPIFMTALTTILAMSTMAMAVGMGAEMTQGLAIVTIGGLIYSTIMTLIVIPVLYDLMNKKDIKKIDVE